MANQEIFKLCLHKREWDCQSFPFLLSRVAELEAEVLLFGVTVVRVWKEDLGQGQEKTQRQGLLLNLKDTVILKCRSWQHLHKHEGNTQPWHTVLREAANFPYVLSQSGACFALLAATNSCPCSGRDALGSEEVRTTSQSVLVRSFNWNSSFLLPSFLWGREEWGGQKSSLPTARRGNNEEVGNALAGWLRAVFTSKDMSSYCIARVCLVCFSALFLRNDASHTGKSFIRNNFKLCFTSFIRMSQTFCSGVFRCLWYSFYPFVHFLPFYNQLWFRQYFLNQPKHPVAVIMFSV